MFHNEVIGKILKNERWLLVFFLEAEANLLALNRLSAMTASLCVRWSSCWDLIVVWLFAWVGWRMMAKGLFASWLAGWLAWHSEFIRQSLALSVSFHSTCGVVIPGVELKMWVFREFQKVWCCRSFQNDCIHTIHNAVYTLGHICATVPHLANEPTNQPTIQPVSHLFVVLGKYSSHVHMPAPSCERCLNLRSCHKKYFFTRHPSYHFMVCLPPRKPISDVAERERRRRHWRAEVKSVLDLDTNFIRFCLLGKLTEEGGCGEIRKQNGVCVSAKFLWFYVPIVGLPIRLRYYF